MQVIKRIYQQLVQQQCLLCGNHSHDTSALCPPCRAELHWHNADSCQQCGLPANHAVCGAFLTHPPYFDYTQAVLQYAYPVDSLLQAYKYHHALYLSQTLGELMLNFMPQPAQQPKVDVMIPMPLHPARLKERGFNQSLELARVIATHTGLALDYHHCQRIKNTPQQASLKLQDRIRNVKDAFICTTPWQGQHVAIVDDVMTSGASLNALAKTLKQAGASTVSCWLVARTL